MFIVEEKEKNGYLLSTDKSKLQVDVIHHFLTNSYWAKGIPLKVVEEAIAWSLCFGLYHENKQVGYARIISDFATMAYLADVFILEEYRGKGLSLWLLEFIIAHPNLQGLRRFMLSTKDGHGLYRKFGFDAPEFPERLMLRKSDASYGN